ncbi:hypothetical protein TrST_g8813 [Triparma strigata]|uniref:Uncharacterized protein n=1 Tax=Triparma strigata TaxID=1606541 RepID=A0A9W7C6R5_9STRA|nr:hypothetical protein TrST_g8813 [Triparma strigata]
MASARQQNFVLLKPHATLEAAQFILQTIESHSSSTPLDRVSTVLLHGRWTVQEIKRTLASSSFPPPHLLYVEDEGRIPTLSAFVECSPLPTPPRPVTNAAAFLETLKGYAETIVNLPPSQTQKQPQLQAELSPPLFILFTSGTTSASKGVRLSSKSVIYQAYAKTTPPVSYNANTNLLLSLPLYHVAGISTLLGVLMAKGAVTYPLPQSSLSTNLKKYPSLNSIVTIPALLHSISSNLKYPNIDLVLTGGSHLTPGQFKKAKQNFANSKIVQTYACTECASSITFIELSDQTLSAPASGPSQHLGGKIVGRPFHRSLEINIFPTSRKSNPKTPLPLNTIGVIGTRGPHVMDGYVSFPDHNPLDFFMTNDLGYLDSNNNLYFCGRVSDVVRSGAETILSAEVENVISEKLQNFVSECAVFPYPDEKWGEVVAIVVVTRSAKGQIPNPSIISNRINEGWKAWGLARHKKPKRIFVAETLPKNSAGKIQKRKLASIYINNIKSKL